ncbi:amino acid ABC transporter permease [Cytobacillus horneckiae]|uniref:Amino acid ABC transporter permease n=1 Tax=Cytobacillus horneckiae TaxID=549687 RepID=A0A2N0ZG71_9BACI|nr:amino acid ABC transporter permease [Cytobacillus horneckiae]MCM3176441.1 amino acid ABC transporter permease [Cytobacillus horneckiae]MEC1155722.1 amino acid ABC transporter permease [Cytobacillus horneckiae]MED2939261.1 amino acid ABC transporter permease [Cytobacillus horneckiae]PKG28483.1 amino acid ABC transporter permease [Cytobacillus horneckiae]
MGATVDVIKEAFPYLLQGLYMTIVISVVSIIISLVIGLIACFMRMSKYAILRYPAAIYVNLIRGTPILIQILFIYFGAPSVLDIQLSAFTAGLIAISLNIGAYNTEIFRGGIESISKGQMEAGRSLGFTYAQTMGYIVLPQAVRRMIPSFVNQLTHAIKDTSMLSVIGIAELTMVGQSIYAMNFKSFEILSMVAIMYFVTIYTVSLISTRLERRFVIS